MTNNITSTDALKRVAFGNPIWRVTIGDGYSTGAYFDDVANGNTKELYLENPSADTYVGIYEFEIRISAEGKVDKAVNVTEDTAGNAPPTGIENKLSNASGSTSVASAALGGDNETGVYSGGVGYSKKTGGASGSPTTVQPSTRSLGGIAGVLGPEDNVVLQVTNDSSSANDISVDLDWVEIHKSEYPS